MLWRDALVAEDQVGALRAVAQGRLAAGEAREDLERELHLFVSELRKEDREADEEAVNAVLDMLTGWCHPDLAL
jgi:hypothetical protein